MTTERLTRAAARLVAMLGEGCAIAGDLAVSAYGYVRATRDVDVIVSMPLEAARRRLAAQGVKTTLFRGDVTEQDFPCLKGVLGGVPFDVLPPFLPLERERRVKVELRGGSLPVVDFETLVRLKLKAGGPKDLLDVAVLVNLRPERRARVLELAAYDPRLQARLVSLVDDPRVKRDAAERSIERRLLDRSRTRSRRPGTGQSRKPRPQKRRGRKLR